MRSDKTLECWSYQSSMHWDHHNTAFKLIMTTVVFIKIFIVLPMLMFLLLFFRVFVCVHSMIVVASTVIIAVSYVICVDVNDDVDDYSDG